MTVMDMAEIQLKWEPGFRGRRVGASTHLVSAGRLRYRALDHPHCGAHYPETGLPLFLLLPRRTAAPRRQDHTALKH